jgi:serine/threonine protein kinase
MLVGKTPFDGGTIVEIFESHLNDLPDPPSQHVPDCPAELSELVMLLLEKSPADRPNDAAAVQSALADILHDRPMRLAVRPKEELDADLAATVHPDRPNLTKRLQTQESIGKARPALLIWITLAILIVVGTVAAFIVLSR